MNVVTGYVALQFSNNLNHMYYFAVFCLLMRRSFCTVEYRLLGRFKDNN